MGDNGRSSRRTENKCYCHTHDDKKHLLPARHIVKHAPWTIRREDLQRPEVLRYVKAARPGKTAPRTENDSPLIPNL